MEQKLSPPVNLHDKVDGEKPAFSMIFDKMRADRSMKRVNTNQPTFLATYVNSFSSSLPSSQSAPVHDVKIQRPSPASLHDQAQSLQSMTTSCLCENHKMQSQAGHVPKFGDWDEKQSFTSIFDKVRVDKSMKRKNSDDPATLATVFNSSSLSSLTSTPLHDVHPRQAPSSSLTSSLRHPVNHKPQVTATKFTDEDRNNQKHSSFKFVDARREIPKVDSLAKRTGKKTTQTTRKPSFFARWRLCFGSGAIKDE